MKNVKLFFVRIGHFTKKHIWSIMLILMTILVGGFFVWDSYTATIDFNPDFMMPKKKEPELFAAPFSGLMVTEEIIKQRPIAVMIENHSDSRPQSGLNEADIIYETIAEGGITRFLAIYQSKESALLGPVRSARPYYVEWADSYDALYAHVGGSQEAITLINKLDVADLNQFYLGKYFWRDNTRWAPHNVYTTTEKLRQAAKAKKYSISSENIKGYTFKKEVEETLRPKSAKFTVNFNANYSPTYTYSPDCNCFARSIKGVVQTDKTTKKKIVAKNVIVVFSVFGSSYVRGTTYTTINTTGSGTAYLYQDGIKKVGVWKRVPGKILSFYDSSGKEFELNPGTTWIDVAPKGTVVK
jgi:hypothetical protein